MSEQSPCQVPSKLFDRTWWFHLHQMSDLAPKDYLPSPSSLGYLSLGEGHLLLHLQTLPQQLKQ